MGLTPQPDRPTEPDTGSLRPSVREGTGPAPSRPIPAPPAGEDDLFRDPFADFLPSER
ncbi:MAG TPA: hypothetical protein VNH46_05420 [Gemmatimonadales bacterium]|nr:hypothetical protein [Gemmatimonadales bacterium]